MEYNAQERKILDAALEVITRNTISGTRMHLIAEEAGMVSSNLHYHFKTKNELLIALFQDIQETYQERRHRYIEDAADTLADKLSGFFNQKKNLILNEPKYDLSQFDFWVLGRTNPEIRALFTSSYEEWHMHIMQTIGQFCPGISEERQSALAYIMISMTLGASMQYFNSSESLNLDLYFDLCKELIFNQIEQDDAQTST